MLAVATRVCITLWLCEPQLLHLSLGRFAWSFRTLEASKVAVSIPDVELFRRRNHRTSCRFPSGAQCGDSCVFILLFGRQAFACVMMSYERVLLGLVIWIETTPPAVVPGFDSFTEESVRGLSQN